MQTDRNCLQWIFGAASNKKKPKRQQANIQRYTRTHQSTAILKALFI